LLNIEPVFVVDLIVHGLHRRYIEIVV